EVDDAETPHPEGDAFGDVVTLVVWTAVDDRVAHPVDFLLKHRTIVQARYSGNAAHRSISYPLIMCPTLAACTGSRWIESNKACRSSLVRRPTVKAVPM